MISLAAWRNSAVLPLPDDASSIPLGVDERKFLITELQE
jgi:hypothetical protein